MGLLDNMIVNGNEEAWLDMMLDDKQILKELGLPSNMSKEMRESVKKMILSDMESVIGTESPYSNIDSDFDETKTPAEQFLNQALQDMGIVIDEPSKEISVSPMDLVVGKKYKLFFPNGNDAIVILNRIMRNSFGDDYIFQNISGAENLTKSASSLLAKDEFPLPISIVMQTKFALIP